MPDIYKIKRGLDIPISGMAASSVRKVSGVAAAVCPERLFAAKSSP